ncbi:sensor histidine kinase [Luteolibacter sp.]|uniref:sensor histidine kinase n=2 Tax=Luteolibacter sp. TaxID=1962973 RepID=UPI0032630AAE
MRGVFLLLGWMMVSWLPAQAREPITNIAAIRALTPEEAASELPVNVRGVVTFSNKREITLFIHDGTNGIYVDQGDLEARKLAVWPELGDQVEVSGVSGNGIFAPVIRGTSPLRIISKGALPAPKAVDGLELAKPGLDCDWVTVDAYVTDVMMNGNALVIQCRAGSSDFHVLIEGPLPPDQEALWDLPDRRVRIRGVVATVFNANGQMTRRFLRVNSPSDVVPLPSAELSQEARLVSSSQLLRLDGPGPNDRVKVEGVVTFDMPGRGVFLRTDGGGLWVQTARAPQTRPGELVEIEGRPRSGRMRPFIHASVIRMMGRQEAPAPINRRAVELLDTRFDSELVSTEAELLNIFRGADGTTFELRDGTIVFRGWLDLANGLPPDLLPGSKLKVSGIAQITALAEYTPMQVEDKLLLRLRSPSDLVLLRPPPWWTPQRLASAFTAILVLLVAIYQRSRLRRKRRQESQRKSFEAVLAERGRFAREIHDSLAQGLTSISLQLECVRNQITDSPALAAGHLETARELVRESMREARRTIWNLRPLALGEADLASALQKYAADLTRDNGISCQQQIEGSPRPLPQEYENALLRIGQESLTNAVRHAAPRRILVRLRFGDGWVTLVVKDDGRGFDVAGRVGKGYGLTGMRERVDALGGSLSIDSPAGEGTEVSVTLPI